MSMHELNPEKSYNDDKYCIGCDCRISTYEDENFCVDCLEDEEYMAEIEAEGINIR